MQHLKQNSCQLEFTNQKFNKQLKPNNCVGKSEILNTNVMLYK